MSHHSGLQHLHLKLSTTGIRQFRGCSTPSASSMGLKKNRRGQQRRDRVVTGFTRGSSSETQPDAFISSHTKSEGPARSRTWCAPQLYCRPVYVCRAAWVEVGGVGWRVSGERRVRAVLSRCGRAMGFSTAGATPDRHLPRAAGSTRTRLTVLGPGEGSTGRQHHGLCA